MFAKHRYRWIHTIVVFFAVAVGSRLYLFSRPCDKNEQTVDVDITAHGNPNETEIASVHPCDVFSSTYEEARNLFRREVESLGLSWDSLLVVDPDYTMDIAVIPGSSPSNSRPGWVIHTSGVHGIEGYAGSAIQLAFLKYLNGYQAKQRLNEETGTRRLLLPPNLPTVILVHAVNPYGMAHYRRTNENNVDLNRNALTDLDLQSLVLSHDNHPFYEKFDNFFNPKHLSTPTKLYFYASVGLWIQAVRYLLQEGYLTLRTALSGSQYYQPNGIAYGGKETRERSLLLLEKWLKSYLSKHSNSTLYRPHDTTEETKDGEATPLQTTPKPVVTWIDVHTGLGPTGVDSLLVTSKHRYSREELVRWFTNLESSSSQQEKTARQVSKGYEKTKGYVIDYFEEKLFSNDPPSYCGMVQEFGTVPSVLVAHSLIMENAVHADPNIHASTKLEWAKMTTRRAFYPQSPTWRKAILQRGLKVLFQAIRRSWESS